MNYQTLSTTDLLGRLNDAEQSIAPAELFVAGDVSMLQAGPRVAIVGSRKASPEGIARARKLAKMLAERGIVVVSGLAEGIDTAAHTAAIKNGGRTLAVLGTPLDEVYPKQNTGLQQQLMEHHLVLSQFPLGAPIQRKNFPMRNTTMALISDATVIVEAAEKSGTLNQGWQALRLSRGLFITKTVAENPTLTWPREMLHYGALVLADDTADVLFESLPQRTEARLNGALPF